MDPVAAAVGAALADRQTGPVVLLVGVDRRRDPAVPVAAFPQKDLAVLAVEVDRQKDPEVVGLEAGRQTDPVVVRQADPVLHRMGLPEPHFEVRALRLVGRGGSTVVSRESCPAVSLRDIWGLHTTWPVVRPMLVEH